MKKDGNTKNGEVIKAISTGRVRTNLLNKCEQKSIAFLVTRIPKWLSSDMLTAIGLFGNLLVFLSFILARYIDTYYLLLNILGFAINWFGDSLDGRVAYYRKTPRKWYGFSLDLTTDWIGTIFIGLGLIIYIDPGWFLLGYLFVAFYGWAIITAMLRYKITGKYSIDSGLFGPTEVRFGVSAVLILEVILNGSIIYSGLLISLALLIVNILDFKKLLKLSNERDESDLEKLNETD